MAKGDTVTFLDSHIECNVGWAEPLLARIKESPKHVVMPIIDSIDPDSFTMHGGGVKLLAFTWTLGQDHSINSKRPYDPVNPMPSPIMAGGLFAMDRKAFFELGTYDQEMRLYGGEEIEIGSCFFFSFVVAIGASVSLCNCSGSTRSRCVTCAALTYFYDVGFRIWQCGYTLECVPCSRIGHIFRTGKYWKGQVRPQHCPRNRLFAVDLTRADKTSGVHRAVRRHHAQQTSGRCGVDGRVRPTGHRRVA